MNTTNTMNHTGGRRWKVLAGLLTAVILAVGLTACRTTHQVSQTEEDFSGFLGDYSMLTKGMSGEANFVYVDKSADWKKYTKLDLKSVEIWRADETNSPLGSLSPKERLMLANLFYYSLTNAFGKDFQIVDQPGPDTLVAHVAITEAGKCRPVINLVTSVYPLGLLMSFSKQAIFGTGIGVGEVRIEAEVTDGVTGQRLAAGVDARAGTKAWRTKFGGTWGDAKLAFDAWSARFAKRAAMFKRGDFSTTGL